MVLERRDAYAERRWVQYEVTIHPSGDILGLAFHCWVVAEGKMVMIEHRNL